jgi:hypothetical protein
MKKVIKIVKKGEDESNLEYWLSLSKQERMENLEEIRQQVNNCNGDTEQGFQRVYRIIKRKQG